MEPGVGFRVAGASQTSSSSGSFNVYMDERGSSSTALSNSNNAVESSDEKVKRPRERLWTTAAAALVAAIPALLVGYTLGFSSSALLDLTGDAASDIRSEYVFSSTLADVFAALAPVGGVFGGLIAGPVSDRWGRKNALVLCGIPYFVGYLVLSYAHYLPSAASFKTLALLGRFLTGVGMGWASMSASVYIGEISSAKFRGVFVSFFQIGLAAGIVVNYAISSIPNFPYYNNSLVAAGIAAGFEVVMVTMYETPRWLVAKGRISEAYRSLRWLRGPLIDIEPEIQATTETQATTEGILASLREFRKRSVAVPLVLVMIVMFFQQAGGLNAIASYAASLFKEAGVANPRPTATYAVGGVELVTTLVSMFVIDLVGRKILLILSGVGMVVGSLLLGVHFYITRPSLCPSDSSNASLSLLELQDSETTACNVQYAPLAIVSIMTFGVGFSLGWGPIPWILMTELTPLRVRGTASGIAILVNWGSAAVIVGFYNSYADAVTTWFAWWSFSIVNICAVVFVVFFIRETKGKSLEDIENYYGRNVF